MDDLMLFLDTIPLLDAIHREEIHKKLATYQQCINEYANKFNLISKNDLESIRVRHFKDALIPISLGSELFVSCVTKQTQLQAIDVGSGAGLPGLPLAIALPGLDVVLLEVNQKKCLFLKKMAQTLQADNVATLCDRSEVFARLPTHREQYDMAFSRAMARPTTALELILPFVKVGGRAFFWASGEEWDQKQKLEKVAELLGSALEAEWPYRLTEGDRQRKILVVRRVSKMGDRYPRRVGVPGKSPLME